MPNSETIFILVHITFRGLDVIIISSARRDQMNAIMEQTTGDRSSIEKPNSNCQIKKTSIGQTNSQTFKGITVHCNKITCSCVAFITLMVSGRYIATVAVSIMNITVKTIKARIGDPAK